MPYWDDKTTWLAQLRDNLFTSDASMQYAIECWTFADSYYWGGDDHEALGWIIAAVNNHIAGSNPLGWFWADPEGDHSLVGFVEQYGLVSWQTIVAAWVSNSFEGRRWTIATIDKMRQMVWEEPFNVLWSSTIENQPTV